ncbi:MAG: UvrD-helicase domain-containing protein [Clostridia bacterium]|nr:UvrD-helicase domain-containing protein [Clostridia bacterium]
MDKLLDRLNEEQIKPVMDTEGAVLVLAGAGSGKTRVLTSRAAYILREGKADLSEILCITFTNKAAAEMRERLEKLLGRNFNWNESRWICTIHSMCVKILRDFAEEAGVKRNFSIYSETERASVIKKSVKEHGGRDEDRLLKDVKFHIPNAKMLGLEPDQYSVKYAALRNIDEITDVYERYCRHLEENNALDFDDLLMRTRKLLRSSPDVREYLSDKFKYIMVDEFQDTNAVQYDIIKMLSCVHGNIFAVGDDDQSIYGWRGAEIKNILSFDKDFPKAKIYMLERNYRSTGNILNLANVIIQHNSSRHGKKLWTEAGAGTRPVYFEADEEVGEALFTCREIQKIVNNGGKYSDCAVLMRINALTRAYEQEFTKYGIPYKVFGGFKFFERREIKDILAYFQIIANPFDNEAFERIINVPRRGIGNKTLEIMREYTVETGLSMYDAASDSDRLQLPAATRKKLKDFSSMIRNFVIASLELPVNALAREIMSVTNLKTAYDDHTDEGEAKLANLNEFLASVDDYSRLNPGATLDEYLTQVTLSTDTDEMDDSDYVTLATIHAVKGLEFGTVFICGLEDGIFPTSRVMNGEGDIEEERRLMYVAITRAKDNLYFTRSRSRYIYGHREQTVASTFVKDLATDLGLFMRHGCYVQGGFGYTSSDPSGNQYGGPYSLNNGSQYGSGYGSGSYGGSSYGGSSYGSSYGSNSGSYGGSYGGSSRRDDSYGGSRSGSSYSSGSQYGSGSTYGGFSNAGGSSGPSDKTYAAAKAKAKTAAGSEDTGGAKTYYAGMKVSHPKFGVGTVVSVKGNSLYVAFGQQGVKELSTQLAPLTILKQ